MPAKNVRKVYIENAYYHIYNRGVEKRIIFEDQQDYGVFLTYLKDYLTPKDTDFLTEVIVNSESDRYKKQKALKLLRLNNFYGDISLLAYCLMPNHFHLLIKQRSALAIDNFMNSLCTRYTMYFNFKYKRVGRLYQDIYKAINITDDEYLLQLSRYIHKQSISVQGDPLFNQPSSFPDYLGERSTKWINTNEILSFFSQKTPGLGYREFVIQQQNESILPSDIALDETDLGVALFNLPRCTLEAKKSQT